MIEIAGLIVLVAIILAVVLMVVILRRDGAADPSPADLRREIRHLERNTRQQMRRRTRVFERQFDHTIAEFERSRWRE